MSKPLWSKPVTNAANATALADLLARVRWSARRQEAGGTCSGGTCGGGTYCWARSHGQRASQRTDGSCTCRTGVCVWGGCYLIALLLQLCVAAVRCFGGRADCFGGMTGSYGT